MLSTNSDILRQRVTQMGLLLMSLCMCAQVQAQETTGEDGHRIGSPASLGPSYSGLVKPGLGLAVRRPALGIKAGDFVVQPRFFVESRYTTNFFRVDTRSTVDNEELGVLSFQLRPGLSLYNPGFSKVALNLGIDANVNLPLSDNAAVEAQTDVGGVATANLSFFPRGILTLTLNEVFRRDLWTRPAASTRNSNLIRNEAGVELAFKPGGGALVFKTSYSYDIDRYDDSKQLNIDRHSFAFLSSWRFYPLTYIFLESSLRISEYQEPFDSAGSGALGNSLNGMPFKVYLGLSGYITEHFAVLLRAGFGHSLLDIPEGSTLQEDFASAIGMLQLTFRFGPNTVLHVGGARDYSLVALGGVRSFLRGYMSFEQQIGRLLLLHVDASYEHRDYGIWEPTDISVGEYLVTPKVSDPERSEQALRIGLLLDFDIVRLFGLTLGYRFEANLSDYIITVDNPDGSLQNFTGFNEHRIFLSANLRY